MVYYTIPTAEFQFIEQELHGISAFASGTREAVFPDMRILDYIYLLWAPNSRAIPQDATTSSPNYLQSHLNRQPTLPLPAETSKSPSTVPVGSTNGQQQQQQQQRSVSAQLFDAGKVDLFYTLTSSHDDTKPKAAVLNLCTLQNLALRQLQHDISRYVGDMYGKTEFVAKLEGLPPLSVLLSRYSESPGFPWLVENMNGSH